MKKIYFLLSGLLFSQCISAQTLTPVLDIGLQNTSVEIPAKFNGKFPTGKTIKIPAGYQVRVFYAGGLEKPRFMSFNPQGVLHVADMKDGGQGHILALPDANHDGVADTAIVVASGFVNSHDVKFYKGHMYVTETLKVWKCTDADHDGIYESKTVFIDNVGDGVISGHTTRTIVFDSAHEKLYLSIGSSCNVCRENDRAIIEEYNDDGTGKRTYATGVRNAVGMALHPKTHRLWADNNGSDKQGNEIPPEWIDLVREDGFYGHPFAYGHKTWFDFDAHPEYKALKPITSSDSSRVDRMIMPAALVRAHSAPMAIQFLNPSFPLQFRKGFLVALRGSWNTTDPKAFRGYKVIYANLDEDTDTTVDYVANFIDSFLTDTVNQGYWGRPVGLAADNMGNVYVSSDEGNTFILQLYPSTSGGVKPVPTIKTGMVYPNPFKESFSIPFTLNARNRVNATLFDITGRAVNTVLDEEFDAGDHSRDIHVKSLPEGIYLLKIKVGEEMVVQKLYHRE